MRASSYETSSRLPVPFAPTPIFPPKSKDDWAAYNRETQAEIAKAREIFDQVNPSCADTINGANYESVLNPLSQRYYDNVPNVYATVLT